MGAFLKIETPIGSARLTPLAPIHVWRQNGRYCAGTNTNVLAYLRIRDDYPVTYCEKAPDSTVHMGYGASARSFTDEFLRIAIGSDGSLRIERDVICTLPLYYGYDGSTLVVSNDFHEVCSSLSRLTPNIAHISQAFHKYTDSLDTLFAEVAILGERQILELINGAVVVHEATPRQWSHNAELTPANPRLFSQVLQEHLDYFFQTRLANASFAFEVSGGLDSSLLPLYLGHLRTIGPLIGYSLVLPGTDIRPRQLEKLQSIQEMAHMRIHPLYLDSQRDSMPAFAADSGHSFLQTMHSIYGPSYSAALARMQAIGIRVVATGAVGDQLFEHTPPPHLYNPAAEFARHRASFATDKIPPPNVADPPCLLSPNTVIENGIRSNIYLAHDIWPVSPFSNLSLFNFCQALPIQHRANKNALRAYYEAAQFPPILYCGPNEEYHAYYTDLMTNKMAARRVEELSANAVCESIGIVETDKIKNLYSLISHRGDDPDNKLYHIYDWLNFENNLRLAQYKHKFIL